MAQTPEEKKAYMAKWRAENKQRIYEYNKRWVEENRESHEAGRAAHREKNREALAEDSKRRYWADPEKGRERAAKRRAADPEAHRANSVAWRAANPEKQKASTQAWLDRNPGVWVVHNNKRRARKAGSEPGMVSKGIVKLLMEAQGGLCAYCRVDLSLGKHLDHKTPLSRGGKHEDANLHLTCPTCNLKKHAKTHEEYLECLS
jgi:5-methylcytosine-specific restriction endonuclease McrA